MQPLRQTFTKLRNTRYLLLCIISATLLLVAWALDFGSYLPAGKVKHVKILGAESPQTQQAVKEIVKSHLTESFWALDVSKVRASLAESVFIDDVVVRKAWPSTLLVKLKQNRFVAKVNDNAVFTNNGELVIGLDLSTNGVQIWVDERLANNAWQVFVHVSDILRMFDLTLKELTMSDRGAVTLTLSDGVVVRLGKNDLYSRLRRFAVMYPKLRIKHNRAINVVDCRYTSGMAVG